MYSPQKQMTQINNKNEREKTWTDNLSFDIQKR